MGSFTHENPAVVHGLVPDDMSKFTDISRAPPVYTNGVVKGKLTQPMAEDTEVLLELYTWVDPEMRLAQVCVGACTAVSVELAI